MVSVLVMLRDPVIIFYVVFVYAVGQLVRLATSEGDLAGLIIGSLILDTLLIAVVLSSAGIVLGPLVDRMPISVLVPASIALACASGAAASLLNLEIRKLTALGPQNFFQLPLVFAYNAVLAALYNLQFISVRHARRAAANALAAAEAGRRAALSELRRLRTQIQPHFLFNVLNNIQVEIRTSPPKAGEMLATLADHLRNQLELEDTLFVTLEADVIPIRTFMALQQMRFGNQISLRLDMSPTALRCTVPAFLLLPLVENATKFGTRSGGAQNDILVQADCDGPVLQIAVSNPGSLSGRPDVPGTQTGLSNLRARLALHYPDRHSFNLFEKDNRVIARIEVKGDPC